MLEGGVGTAADGVVAGGFEHADGGIEEGGVEGAHVGGGIDPGEVGGIEPIAALPAAHGDDFEGAGEAKFGLEHAGEFAGGHAVAEGEGVGADEGFAAFGEDGAFDADAVDGVGAVEDEERHFAFGGFLHDVAHGADVGIEAGADVLDVEDDDVDGVEHGGGGAAIGVLVEAPDFDLGGGVLGVLDAFAVLLAEDAVFGGEDGGEVDAGGDHDVDVAFAVAGEAGVVGDEADAFALEAGELFADEDIEAGIDGAVAVNGAADAVHGVVVAVEDGGGDVDAEGGGGDGGDFGAEGGDGEAAFGVDAVGEEDDVGAGGGIDPEGGAGEAGVADGAQGKEFAAIGGEGGVHVEAEAAEDGLIGGGLWLGELADGEGAEVAFAVEFAVGEDHAGEAGEVGGGGEEAGVAGDAVHEAGGGVVDDAEEGSGGFGELFGGGDAGAEGGGRVELGLGHAEGEEDLLAGELIEGEGGDAADDFAEEDEVDVGVDEAFAGGGDGFIDEGFLDAGFVAAPFGFEVDIGAEAGEVGEEHADGDVGFAALELREVGGDLVVEADLALFDEAHDGGGGGDDLGEGGGVEDGVDGHGGAGGGEAAAAVGLAMEDLAVAADPGDGAGHLVGGDGFLDDAVDFIGAGETFLCGEGENGEGEDGEQRAHLLEPFGEFFEFGGEHDVLGGDAAGVVGGEVDDDAIPDVGPFGVVFHGFDGNGGGGHEAEGVDEIGEGVFAVQLSIEQRPAGECFDGGCEFHFV